MNSRRPPGEAQALRWVVARLPYSTGRRRESNVDRRELDVGATAAVLVQQLLGLDICQITPLQALSLLHDLQQQARTLVANREVSA
jgi:hypothetical protein